jgi:hypothetical protein
MSDTAFPIGWHVIEGTLGTDVLIDTSTVLSGGAAVHFPSTASATAKVVSDWTPIDDLSPTGASNIVTEHYLVWVNARASRVNANDDLLVQVQFSDVDRQTNSFVNIFADSTGAAGSPLSTPNSWETVGDVVSAPSGRRYMRLIIERDHALDFDLYIDSAVVRAMPPGVIAKDTGTDAFAGTWTTHTGWTVDTSLSHQYQLSSGVFTLHQPGLYNVHAHASVEDNLSDGDAISVRIAWRKTGSATVRYIYGSTVWASAAHTYQSGEPTTIAAGGIIDIASKAYAAGASPTTPGIVSVDFLQLAGTGLNYTDAYFSCIRISDI